MQGLRGLGGVLMDRPPPRGAPWELVWSANSQRPYLQKGRSHAHVKWRLCGRPRYGLMVCRATFSLESEGLIQDLRATAAPCSVQGAHVPHQFSSPSSRQFYVKLFKYKCSQGLNQCQVTSVRKHGCALPPSLVNPSDPAPVEGKTKKPPDESLSI